MERLFDSGSGTPLVVVQPLQGRWQWTAPLLRELARRVRVISYSLSDGTEPGNGDTELGAYVMQLTQIMDQAGVDRAALCGISFGGAVAARFAASHPERVTSLVIASSPGPGWRPNAVQAGYVARPWLSLPAFVAGAAGRVLPELASAIDSAGERISFALRYLFIAARYPAMPYLMAQRVRALERIDLESDCARITAPTLVLTGEEQLDCVVPVSSTLKYAELIPGARCLKMERTGHLGTLTQPRQFAAVIADFVNANHS